MRQAKLPAGKEGSFMEYKFTTANFDAEVLQSELPVLVDFYADWCNPCKMMAPVVESIAETLEGKAKVGKCNIDENMPLAQEYSVASIPTFMIFKGGQAVATYRGAMSEDDLLEHVEQELG